jgi:hypothetical protein
MQSQQNFLLLLAGCPLSRHILSKQRHSDACPVDRPCPTGSLIRTLLFMPRTSNSAAKHVVTSQVNLWGSCDVSILDGCAFKLDSFETTLRYSESLQKFLNSQPSLTNLTIWGDREPFPPFDERCLPNLNRVKAMDSLLRILIPGRPVREVTMISPLTADSTDWSFFTFSTTPIQKLCIHFDMLYTKPVSFLVSIFPSLVHLVVYTRVVERTVRVPLCLIGKY